MSTPTTDKVLDHVTTATSGDLMFFVQCFGFLLPRNSVTALPAFADKIKAHYDLSDPRTQEAVVFLESHTRNLLIESSWKGFRVFSGN